MRFPLTFKSSRCAISRNSSLIRRIHHYISNPWKMAGITVSG